jgi:thymidylate synthase (FAD)
MLYIRFIYFLNMTEEYPISSPLEVRLIGHMRLPDYLRNDLWDATFSGKKHWVLEHPEFEQELLATACALHTRSNDYVHDIMTDLDSPEEVVKRINGFMKMKPLPHSTVAGFMEFIFEIRGVSRALTHELVRHRTGWYLQQTQRHLDISKNEDIIPDTIKSNNLALARYQVFDQQWRDAYLDLRNLGIPAEDARAVAPNACSSAIVMKIDGANLVHLLHLRKDKNAYWEIRRLANELHSLAKTVAPTLFSDENEKYWW